MKRRMMGGKRYSYTIDSNCNGGNVYLDDVYKGSISGGRLVVEIVAGKESYDVRISGGVPPGYTATGTDHGTDYSLAADGPTDLSFAADGSPSPYTLSFESKQKPRWRDYSHPVYYTPPSNSKVRRDLAVTMNYTSSNGPVSYGDWAYGSWAKADTYWGYGDPSWCPRDKTSDGFFDRYTFRCQPSGSARSDWDNLTQSGSGDKIRVNFSQRGSAYSYTVYSNVEGAAVYFNGSRKGDISGGRLDVSIEGGDSYYDVTMGPKGNTSSTAYSFDFQSSLTGKIANGGADGIILAEIISTKSVTTTTYSTPSGQRVSRGGSVTLNYGVSSGVATSNLGVSVVGDTGFLTGVSVTDHGTYKTVTGNCPGNGSGAERSKNMRFQQEGSGRSVYLTVTQEVVSQTFTLYSDREGGEVTCGASEILARGTISGGKFVYTHVGEFTGGGVAFIISGGTPPPYTRTGWSFGVFTSSDSSVAYLREVTVSALSWQDYPDLWIISSKDTYERAYDTDPLVGSCEPDGSLTLNATYEDTCVKREYMNAGWSIPAGVSWIGPTYDDGMTGVGIWGTQRRIRYSTTEANSGSSPRSCTITFTQRWLAPDSPMPDVSITFTQKGSQPVVTQSFTVRNLTDREGMLSIAKTGVEPVRGKKWKVSVRSQFGVASLDTLTDGTTWRSGDTLCMFFDGQRVVNKKVYDNDIVDINNTSV